MDLILSKRWTAHWEGRRAVAYDDATGESLSPGKAIIGNPTIGIGLNLNTASARIAIEGLGLNFDAVRAGRVALTDGQIDQLFTQSQNRAIAGARSLFPDFDTYPDDVQLVITDLCFNMGPGALATFTETCAAIRAQDRLRAGAALQDSRWFHQVGSGPDQRGGADVAVLSGRATAEDILNR